MNRYAQNVSSQKCVQVKSLSLPFQILALVAVRKAMDYLFSQHDLSFLDDVIPEKDKKKKEDEKKKKKKKGSLDSDNEDVRNFSFFLKKKKTTLGMVVSPSSFESNQHSPYLVQQMSPKQNLFNTAFPFPGIRSLW